MVVHAFLNKLAGGSVIPEAWWASAGHVARIPQGAVNAGKLRRHTGVVDEYSVTDTDAGLGEVVPDLASSAGISHTKQVVPDSGRRTLTGPGVLIPYCSTLTSLNHCAKLTIPLSASLADAGSVRCIPHFSVGAVYACSAIPVEARWTIALHAGIIPALSAAAGFSHNAGGSVPCLAVGADADLVVLVPDSSS